MQMQLPLEVSRAQGLIGMERAADRAERCSPGWNDLALERIRDHVSTLPFDRDFIVEDVRLAIQAKLPEVPELRVWGSVTQAAIRLGFLVRTGRFMPAASSHCSPKAVYRRGIAA